MFCTCGRPIITQFCTNEGLTVVRPLLSSLTILVCDGVLIFRGRCVGCRKFHETPLTFALVCSYTMDNQETKAS